MTVGLTRDAAHNYFLDGAGPIPSVTNVLRVVDKSGPLVGWAKRETARCAVDNLDVLNRMVASGGKPAALAWLKGIPDYQRDTSADLGTRIHDLAERVVRGEDVTTNDEEAPYVEAYRRFLAAHRPKFLAVEEMVCSLRHNYAGTFDSIAVIAGERWLLDIKTGTGVYPETALQLAAYAAADFIGRPGDPTRYPVPRVKRFGVVHVRPEGAKLVPFAVDRTTFAAFLNARRLHDWRSEQAKAVIQQPIEGAAA